MTPPRDKDEENKEFGKPSVVIALTPAEYDQLRQVLLSWPRLEKMVIAHERAQWFWSSLGIWLKWIAAVSAALIAAKLLLGDMKEILRGWLK